MGTLQFNKNGPVIVTEEDFGIFLKSNYSSFDQMFYAWLDENNRNGVRRLCLRDMLRQFYGEKNPEITHYQFDHGFTRIMHVGGGDKTKELYWTLRNRPRLLEEIISEFLYNLENNYVPTKSINKKYPAKLIEFLLTVAKLEDVRKLWQYHPLNADTDIPLPKRMSERLRLYTGRANLPQTIRDELWRNVSRDLIAAINSQSKTLVDTGIPPIAENCMMSVIVNFIDTINNESYHDDSRSMIMVTECIKLLEDNLPHTVAYLDWIDMERILQKINDRQVANKSLCRHITILTEDELSSCKLNFLYWARGIITFYSPDKTKCLEKIDTCISNYTEYEIVFQ